MWLMSFTLDTSHFEMSRLNDVIPRKIALMSVTLDKSHSPIVPCGPSEQSRSRVNVRQVVTAFLSSALDCGEHRDRPAQEFGDMEIKRAKKMT